MGGTGGYTSLHRVGYAPWTYYLYQQAYDQDGKIRTRTNNAGGICGGMSTGMPIVFRVAIKPTPSIAKEQDTINLKTGENVKIAIKGRHDPCIALRAAVVVRAAAAFAIHLI